MEELNKEVVDQTPENTVEETTEQPIEEVVETKTKEQNVKTFTITPPCLSFYCKQVQIKS